MCIVCKFTKELYGSASCRSITSRDIISDFDLSTPKKALTHLERGKRYGVFSQEDLALLVSSQRICEDHANQYAQNLTIVTDLASQYVEEKDEGILTVEEYVDKDGVTKTTTIRVFKNGTFVYGK